jgi:hypothetical protein
MNGDVAIPPEAAYSAVEDSDYGGQALLRNEAIAERRLVRAAVEGIHGRGPGLLALEREQET